MFYIRSGILFDYFSVIVEYTIDDIQNMYFASIEGFVGRLQTF